HRRCSSTAWMSLKSRERSIWPCQYRTRSSSLFSVQDIRASEDRDLVGAGCHKPCGAQTDVAALRLAVAAGPLQGSHIVNAGNFLDDSHDLGAVHVPAEGPAGAVWAAHQRIEEFVERGHHRVLQGCLVRAPLRPNSSLHRDLEIGGAHNLHTRAHD